MTGRLLAALLLVWATALGTSGLRSLSTGRGQQTRRALQTPLAIGRWNGSDVPVSEWEQELLRTRDFVFRIYRGLPEEPGIWLLATWSANDLEAVHPSDDCYTANGYEITAWERRLFRRSGGAPVELILKEVSGRGERRLFFDLFRTAGGWRPSVWSHMAALLRRALLSRDAAGGKVRLETLVGAGGREQAWARLEAFLEAALPLLEERLR